LKEYSQVLVLDTNIILNDAEAIFDLSEHSKNLIVIPEIVLDETDSHKSGFSEINFQARKFGRLLDNAELIDIDRRAGSTRTLLNINHGNNVDLLVVSKERYISVSETTDPKIVNDRKIIEIAQDMKIEFGNKLVFLTQDVMCRLRALSLDLQAEAYDVISDEEVILFNEFSICSDFELKKSYSVQEIIEEFCVEPFGLQLQKDGITKLYYKVSNMYQEVQEDDIKRQNIKPKNVGQKIFASLMLEPSYDMIISDSPAGSGKTLQALSTAMRLLDTNKDKYDKIVYIRKTVISDDQDLGFLPGDLTEKMVGYLGPLYTNLEYIVQEKYKNRKEKIDKQELQEQIDKLVEKYGIEFMYEGHLRGTNIRNAVVIWDECLSENQVLETSKGKMSIKDIYKLNKTEDVFVKSYNHDTEKFSYEYINSIKCQDIEETQEEMFEIETEDGEIIQVTGNHRLFVNGEYKYVKDIEKGDFLYGAVIELKKVKIVSIKKVPYTGKIYTPSVDNNHNYMLGNENPILSKNCQNDSISSAKTLLTRVDDNSKVFAIGSVNQIDNKFVSKSNNALTFLLSKVYTDTDNVRIAGINLKKVERSRIAEWADKF